MESNNVSSFKSPDFIFWELLILGWVFGAAGLISLFILQKVQGLEGLIYFGVGLLMGMLTIVCANFLRDFSKKHGISDGRNFISFTVWLGRIILIALAWFFISSIFFPHPWGID